MHQNQLQARCIEVDYHLVETQTHPVGIGLLFTSQFALDLGVFNGDILEFHNASRGIELIELRALKSPRFPPFYCWNRASILITICA